jgi:polyisoprenoid-binding protein YceI
MKKLLILVAVLVVGAVAFGAWYVFGDDAPAKPTLAACGASSSGSSSSGSSTPDGSWKVAPGSDVFVGYRMTEQFAGDVVHKTAVGRTPAVSGTMRIAGGNVTDAAVTAQMQELSSNRAARDNYIHEHGIESDKFPTSKFALSSPITLPAGLEPCAKVNVSAVGKLTLHGVTKSVTVPLEAQWDGVKVTAVGNAPIVLADYNIEPPKTSVVSVDNHGSLDVSLAFTRS